MRRFRTWFKKLERWERIGLRIWFVVYVTETATAAVIGMMIGGWHEVLWGFARVVIYWVWFGLLFGMIFWGSRVEIARKAKSPATEIGARTADINKPTPDIDKVIDIPDAGYH